MSSIDQTHKRYLQDSDDSVYWPITAWDAVAGKPTDLVDKAALDAAIAAIQKPETYPMITDQTALQNLANMGGD